MKDGRNKILAAAFEILCKVRDPEKVTVREIAKRAGVGTGLIGYHFASKDAMLMESVGHALSEMALRQKDEPDSISTDPRRRLRHLLRQWMTVGAEQFYLIQLASRFELTEGDVNTPQLLLPLVLEITNGEDRVARMIAFSIASNMQSAALRPKQFHEYSGYDILNPLDQERYIKDLIESHLPL